MGVFLRLLSYHRSHAGRLVVAFWMLAASGALMAAVVATVKPLVDQVLLGKPAGSGDSGEPNILVQLREPALGRCRPSRKRSASRG